VRSAIRAVRGILLLASSIGVLIVLGEIPALAQTTTSSPSPAPPPTPVLPTSTTAVVLVAVAIVAIFLAWTVPLWTDAQRAYAAHRRHVEKILARLADEAAKDKEGLTVEDIQTLLPAIVRPPEGMRGLARVLLAFLITSIVAVITMALMFSSASGVFDVIKQIVTALLGVLATVIGFYFGARTAEGANAGPSGSRTTQPSPTGEGSDTETTEVVTTSLSESAPM
jgi:nitrogen fixation-related uncharacterized protein